MVVSRAVLIEDHVMTTCLTREREDSFYPSLLGETFAKKKKDDQGKRHKRYKDV